MDHEITIYIEIPVQVSFSTHPAEKRMGKYPACEAELQVDSCRFRDWGDAADVDECLQSEYGDYIYQQCVDSVGKDG